MKLLELAKSLQVQVHLIFRFDLTELDKFQPPSTDKWLNCKRTFDFQFRENQFDRIRREGNHRNYRFELSDVVVFGMNYRD